MPEMVTFSTVDPLNAALVPSMLKARAGAVAAAVGCRVRLPDPGPVIVTLSVIGSCEARLIVRGVAKNVGSNVIVSGVFAALVSRIAWRSEPAPESLALVTTRLSEINTRNEPTGWAGTATGVPAA